MSLTMGMAIVSIVAMTGAYISVQTKKTGTEGESLYHLNQDHILALQKSKSISAVKAALGITPTSPAGQCLAGRGTGCDALAVSNWAAIPGMGSQRAEPNGRIIATSADHKLECGSPDSCEALLIKVTSTLTNGSTTLYKRQSETRLGGIFLSDRREIDFSCVSATGGLLTAMNMRTLRGECLPLPASSGCPSQRPLTVYRVGATPGCQPNKTLNCPTGIGSIGILSG